MKRLPFVIRRGNLKQSEAEFSTQMQENIALIRKMCLVGVKAGVPFAKIDKELAEGNFINHFKVTMKGDEFDLTAKTPDAEIIMDYLLCFSNTIEEATQQPFEDVRPAMIQYFKTGGVA